MQDVCISTCLDISKRGAKGAMTCLGVSNLYNHCNFKSDCSEEQHIWKMRPTVNFITDHYCILKLIEKEKYNIQNFKQIFSTDSTTLKSKR